jgi:hypothetical protein
MTTQTLKSPKETQKPRRNGSILETDGDKLHRTQIHQLHHQHAIPVRNGMCTVSPFTDTTRALEANTASI